MGKLMGAYDSDELDRPDLNKCPECGCFFAGDDCPLCGMTCPEEFRAGNRKKVKLQKKKNDFQSSRVTFVPWYHSLWFILLIFFVSPVVSIVLLFTSPHKKSLKIGIAAVILSLFVLSTIGIGFALTLFEKFAFPDVNTNLSQEEYIEKCTEISAESYFRSPSAYENKYVTLTLKVQERFYDYDGSNYYICEDTETPEFRIIIKDCRQNSGYFVKNDVITLYGEGRNKGIVYDSQTTAREGPIINARFIEKN